MYSFAPNLNTRSFATFAMYKLEFSIVYCYVYKILANASNLAKCILFTFTMYILIYNHKYCVITPYKSCCTALYSVHFT